MRKYVSKTIADWHKEYFPFVLRRCRQMLHNTQDAEDAAQEVFIRLLKAERRGMDLDETTNEENLLWIYATNVCLTFIRDKKKKQGNDVSLFEEGIPTAGSEFERLDAKMLLQSVIEQELEETRLYCYMYFYDRMNLKEIAKTVGKSKSWVHRKIEQFKRDTRRKLEETMK
jgi:RNA polymerase sigma-70 factor (ECF subfamily)